MGFNIFEVEAHSIDLELRHPGTREPSGVIVTLKPPTHPDLKKLDRENMNELLRDRGRMPNAHKVEERNMRRVLTAMEGWRLSDSDDGANANLPEFSESAARRLFKENPSAYDQIYEALNDEARFYGGDD